MSPQHNARLAWSIAIASLALWATSAPVTWGQIAGAGHFFEQTTSESSNTTTSIRTMVDESTGEDGSAAAVPCVPLLIPPPGSLPVEVPPLPVEVPPPVTGSQEATYHLCGPDTLKAQAIEQLIAGRSFSTRLSARGDGCADLMVSVTSPGVTGGRAASTVNVSLGGGQNLAIQIVSENGATHVTIGGGR